MPKVRRLAAQLQTVPEMCAVDGAPAAANRDGRSPTKRQTGSTQQRAHQHHSILAADSNHGAAHSGEGMESVFEPPVTARLQAEQHTNDRGSKCCRRCSAAAPAVVHRLLCIVRLEHPAVGAECAGGQVILRGQGGEGELWEGE